MIHSLRLRDIDRSKIKPRGREETLAILRRFQNAQDRLEKRCSELGIPVPQMMC